MATRFAEPVSDVSESILRSGAVPANTKTCTEWGVRVWNEWAQSRAAPVTGNISPPSTPLLELSIVDLAYWMGKFVLEVRKKDGTEYPPKSLYALVCCFKRFYEQNGVYDINPLIPSDARFGNFRATLDAEMKRLHGLGLGTTTKKAEPISADEESLLWTSGQFGTHNANVILNTVYYYNCKVFGLRSFDEHRNLKCSQFDKKVDEGRRVYLEYTDFGSKTNRGGLKHMKVENKTIRQYENIEDEDHCVVNIFAKYLSFLPGHDKHFYYRPLSDDGSGTPRFANQPVGRNKLSRIIPEMCKAAGIQGYKTGHSGKVTCATALYQQNFSDQLIKERTGHRSLESLHKYKRTGSEQQYEMSMALLPSVARKEWKENAKKTVPKSSFDDDDDDFQPLKKKPKVKPEDMSAMFPMSSLTNCTFNINFK